MAEKIKINLSNGPKKSSNEQFLKASRNWEKCSALYGLPHGIIKVLNTILYENEFQNPQILMDTLEIT
jgi:hypothetical protein